MKPFLFAHAYKNTEPTLYSCPTFRTVNNTTSDTHTYTHSALYHWYTDEASPFPNVTDIGFACLKSVTLGDSRFLSHAFYYPLPKCHPAIFLLNLFLDVSAPKLLLRSFSCYALLFLRCAMFCYDNQVKFDNTVGVKCFQPVWTGITTYLL